MKGHLTLGDPEEMLVAKTAFTCFASILGGFAIASNMLSCLGATWWAVWKSKSYGAFVLNHRVDLHAIDVAPARWRDDAGSSPLDGASTVASSPRNEHPTHWLISTQARALHRVK